MWPSLLMKTVRAETAQDDFAGEGVSTTFAQCVTYVPGSSVTYRPGCTVRVKP